MFELKPISPHHKPMGDEDAADAPKCILPSRELATNWLEEGNAASAFTRVRGRQPIQRTSGALRGTGGGAAAGIPTMIGATTT